jgi:hypothetical protein
MPVHDVEMNPVGTRLVDGPDLFAEPGEVGGEDRRRDDEGAGRERF